MSASSRPAHEPAHHDATAQVIQAWGRERPDLDARPLEVFSRVTRLAKYLDQVRAWVFKNWELEGWEFDVLAELRRSGPPYELKPGQMSAQMLVSSGTMTNRIDRLEAAALVERHGDPVDARSTRVRLTEAGRARVDGAMAGLVRREAELLQATTIPQRATTADTLAAILEPLEADPWPAPSPKSAPRA